MKTLGAKAKCGGRFRLHRIKKRIKVSGMQLALKFFLFSFEILLKVKIVNAFNIGKSAFDITTSILRIYKYDADE